jgi:hypothetical protein
MQKLRGIQAGAAVATLVCLVLPLSVRGADRGKAVYIGGTLSAVKEKSQAAIDLKGEENLVFSPKGVAPVQIPWSGIREVEYGQKVGHRVKTAIFLTPLALFSKNRRHYVTLAWKDAEGKDQAAVFEFDKNDIRPALASIRARSGKDIVYQDEQAKKQMGAPTEK